MCTGHCSAGTCTWSLATHHALHITYHEYCLCMMYSHCSCVPLKFKNVYFEAVFAGYIISSWMKAIWSQGNCGHSWCWDKLCWPLVWWGNWGTVSRFTNDIIYNRCTTLAPAPPHCLGNCGCSNVEKNMEMKMRWWQERNKRKIYNKKLMVANTPILPQIIYVILRDVVT